jgi:hypothetical protein
MTPPILFLMIESTLFLIANAKSDDDNGMVPSLIPVEKFGSELPLSIEPILLLAV